MENLNKKKSLLTLLILFAGGFVPIMLIVLSFGYAQYFKQAIGPKAIKVAHEFAVPYIFFIYIPSILFLIWALVYTKKNYPDLFRRIWVGLAAGAIATIGLDWIRQMGVTNGWLPGDFPSMFGKMMTGSNTFSEYFWAGTFNHFSNGAGFGLILTLVFGRYATLKKTVLVTYLWVAIIELSMMVGPPTAPTFGLFGVRYMWPELFLLSLAAHIVFATILGILVHYWLKPEDSKWLWQYLKSDTLTKT